MLDKTIAITVAICSLLYSVSVVAGNEPTILLTLLDQFLISLFAFMWAYKK